MEIILNQKESEDYFYNALCNGLGYIESYGLILDFDKDAYNKARKDGDCIEDVLMQMLRNGKALTLVDTEGDESWTITLDDIHNRMNKVPHRYLFEMYKEIDDATTADGILQYVFMEDIIFG